MQTNEVVVVGAGPAGCSVARKLAEHGTSVSVIEEHSQIGEPLHCAGLVTQRAFDLSGCPTTANIIQNRVRGAIVHPPNGPVLRIGGEQDKALVINRQKFDETLADQAKKAGAIFHLEHKVIKAKKQQNQLTLTIQHNKTTKTINSPIVIGADGPHSLIRKQFDFPQPMEMLQGMGAEITDTNLDPHFVHIYLGNNIAPGFFAWVIPTNTLGTSARIGLCISKPHHHPLQHYFQDLLHQPLIKNATIIRHYGGSIPLGPLKKTATDNIMLLGDAAAHVKPLSGGGIVPGLLCAHHCATIAHKAMQHSQFTEQNLSSYHILCRKEIGRELALGMKFRKLFCNLSDTQIDKYAQKLNDPKVIGIINTHGDIDYPSRLLLPLIKVKPSLLKATSLLLKKTKKS